MANKELTYGVQTLSEFVDDFCTHSFNNDRKYYDNLLKIAESVWTEINTKVIPVPVRKRIPVEQTTFTAPKPSDCMLIRGVSIINHCNTLQPLAYNEYKYVTPLPTMGCGCGKCECKNDICAYVHSELKVVLEDVYLNGTKYTKTIKTKVCDNGDMVEEITEPFAKKVGGNMAVQSRTYNKFLANLEVAPCGCVQATVSNRNKVYEYCGCPVKCCTADDAGIYSSANGHWKLEDDIIYLFDTQAKYIVVTYLSSSKQPGTEILIPEYAAEAMFAGIFFKSIRFRPKVIGYYDRREARQTYSMELLELYQFLNPITEEDFKENQQGFHKW